MSYSELDLINYRLERAKESLEEAKILAQAGHWNTVVNRLYYFSKFPSLNFST